MIKVEQLYKKFGRLVVLDRVNLHIERQTCVALLGPNASGKTTLIKSILGLVIPTEGNISVLGQETSGHWNYRKHIGYMPQIGHYPQNMSIRQLFGMITDIRNKPLEQCDVDLMKSFKVEEIYSKRLGTLSGGTRQKVSACLAFLFNPDILLLDEPTAGLDPVSCEMVKEKIQASSKQGKLIIITSHILSDLDEMTNEVIFMQEGKIRFRRSLDYLRNETQEQKLSKALVRYLERGDHE